MAFASSQIGLIVVILGLNSLTYTEGDDSVCAQGWFGSACSKECHCPTVAECSPVNGFCSSGRCHQQWFGTGCQTRLPQLTAGPEVESLTEETICIGWRQWNRSFDVGDVNVTSYAIQGRLNFSSSATAVDWTDLSLDVVINKTSGKCRGCLEHIDLNTEYEFRIIPIWLDYGKPQKGLPSNASKPIVPSTVLSGLRTSTTEIQSSPTPIHESADDITSLFTDERQLFTSSQSLADNTNHRRKLTALTSLDFGASTSNPSSRALHVDGDLNDANYPRIDVASSPSGAVTETLTVGSSSSASSTNLAPQTGNAPIENNTTWDKTAFHLPATATLNRASKYATAVTPVAEITLAKTSNLTTAVTYRATETTAASINVANITTGRLAKETSSLDAANVSNSQSMGSKVSLPAASLTTPPLPISSSLYSLVTSSSTNLRSSITSTVTSSVFGEDGLVPSVSTKADSKTTFISSYSETANARTNSNSISLSFSTTSSQSDHTDFVTTVADTTTRAIANIAPEGPVINLTLELSSTDQSSIVVSWKPPVRGRPFLSGYSISYSIVGIGDCSNETQAPEPERNISSSIESYTIQDTFPWRRYHVRISSLYSNRSYPSLAEIISSETDPVGVPWNLRNTDSSSRSFSVAWNDVPCSQRGGRLVYYDARIQELNSSIAEESKILATRPSIDVSHVLPFTRYSVRVRYVSAVGHGPFCDDYIVQTDSDAPPRPGDVEIRNVTDEAVFVTWSSPRPPYGLLQEYRVIYWMASTGAADQNSDIINVNTVNAYQWITGLQPYTYYYVQVQARNLVSNGDGWGSRSLVLSQVTKDGRPSTPVELRNTSRSDTCITVEWRPPATPNGIITSYKVSYSLLSILVNIKEENLQSNVQLYLACALTPAMRYQFRVAAATRNYLGEAKSVDVSTEPGVPPVPASPSMKAVTKSTVTMLLQPVTSTLGPVTWYFVVVYDLAGTSRTRKKRSTNQDPVEMIPLPGYTAAKLAVSQVTGTYEFTVGDGQIYGGYLNTPLRPDSLYTIYYVVASTFDSVTRMSFTQTVYPIRTLPLQNPDISTPKNPITSGVSFTRDHDLTSSSIPRTTFAETITESKTTMIVIVVVVVLVVLIAAAAVSVSVWCYCHRRNHQDSLEHSFDRTKQSWVKYYHNNFSKDADKLENNKSYKLCANSEAASSPMSVADADCCLDDVPVAEIQIYRKKNLEAEFRALPSGNDLSSVVGSRAENKNMSRNGVLPFDHSRVSVQTGGASDYYNASYVPNYKGCRRAYIAAESPFNGTTLRRFWNMIYQENVRHIVFMEGSLDHLPKYWPNENGATITYGNVMVSLVNARRFASFVVRTFLVSLSGEKRPRHVKHYHFTEWTEDEMPNCPIALIEFRSKLRSSPTDLKLPVLVHCRTGVDKTCVFVAIDSLLMQAKAENCVNVYEVCAALRRHRSMSISTEKHYTFVCDVIVEALCTNYTVITNRELRMTYRLMTEENTKSHKSCLTKQFELITDSCATVGRRTPHMRGLSVVELDSYQSKNAFLLVELPSPSRESEFWKLLHEKGVRCVVTLSSDARSDDAQYPEKSKTIGPFALQVTEADSSYRATVVRTVRLRRIQAQQPDLVFKQFGFYDWDDEDIPMSKHAFIRMLKLVHDWRVEASASDAPVVVQCKDGSSKSGLFCACYVLCQRMAADGQVDIFHAIKSMKLKAPDIINSQEQYKFCFKVLWDYVRLSRPSVESLGLESNSSENIRKSLRLAAKLSTKQRTQDGIEDTETKYKETNIMIENSDMEPENTTNVRTIISIPKEDSEENIQKILSTPADDSHNVQIESTESPNEDRKINIKTILSTPQDDASNA